MNVVNTCKENIRLDMTGKVTHWELCKEIEIWPYYKMVYHKPESIPENEKHKILLGFWDINKSPNSSQKIKPNDI